MIGQEQGDRRKGFTTAGHYASANIQPLIQMTLRVYSRIY